MPAGAKDAPRGGHIALKQVKAGSQRGRGRFTRPAEESAAPPDEAPDGPRIALVGGSKLHQEALMWLLSAEGAKVVGAFGNAGGLVPAIEASDPDVVVIDADDHDAGVAAIVELRDAAPELKIALLAEIATPQLIRAAVERRVEGVLLKEHSADELVSALQHILRGRSVFPAGWQELAAQVTAPPPLTDREHQVLQLLGRGLRNQQFAAN